MRSPSIDFTGKRHTSRTSPTTTASPGPIRRTVARDLPFAAPGWGGVGPLSLAGVDLLGEAVTEGLPEQVRPLDLPVGQRPVVDHEEALGIGHDVPTVLLEAAGDAACRGAAEHRRQVDAGVEGGRRA